jgi:protoporphyrinogen oxidase
VGILGETSQEIIRMMYRPIRAMNLYLATGPDGTGMFIHDSSGKELAKITSKKVISKPSVSLMMVLSVVYVASDKKIYFATIDWAKAEFKPDQVFDSRGIWYNAIISKDGSKIAAIYTTMIRPLSMCMMWHQKEKVILNCTTLPIHRV